MSLRIAILLTNNDDSAFAQAFPNDGQKVANLLRPLRPHWQFSVVRVIDGELPASADAFDGYVITGSPASVNDDRLPWVPRLLDFIRQLHAGRHRTIGLCFGHQAIARALGGQVQRNPQGWCLGLHATQWVAPLPGTTPWMAPPRAHTTLLAAHNEQVTQLPPGAQGLSRSDFCPHGAFSLGSHIVTTQYHPEMSPLFMHALLKHLYAWATHPHTQAAAAAARLSLATLHAAHDSLAGIDPLQAEPLADAQVFAQWMVQFLEPAT